MQSKRNVNGYVLQRNGALFKTRTLPFGVTFQHSCKHFALTSANWTQNQSTRFLKKLRGTATHVPPFCRSTSSSVLAVDLYTSRLAQPHKNKQNAVRLGLRGGQSVG